MTSTRTKTSICNMALDVLNEGPLTDVDTDDTSVSRWFVRNYEEARDAELREHVWKFATARQRIYPRDYILRGRAGSIYGTLSGAWGLVRLIESWSGDLVTLRRSSDSATDSFGFLIDETDLTLLDEGSDILLDEVDVATFLGGSTGYVTTLNDQSGNGRHLVQATTTKQPVYEETDDLSGRPMASFDGDDDLLATAAALSNLISTTVGWLVVAGRIDELGFDSATATADHLLLGDLGQKIGLYVRAGGNLYGYNDDGSADTITDSVPVLEPFVATLRHDTTTLKVSVNGREEVSGTSGATSSLASIFQVGDVAGSNALDFHLSAVLAFSTPPAAEERKRIVERLMRWSKAGGAQEVGWQYRYPVPADYLRILPARLYGGFEADPVVFEVEGGDILTNQNPYVDFRYIRQVTDPTRMDPLFVQALAGRLAAKLAHWLTGKAGMVQIAAAFADEARRAARRANAIEGSPERPYASEIIGARYRSGDYPHYPWPRQRIR